MNNFPVFMLTEPSERKAKAGRESPGIRSNRNTDGEARESNKLRLTPTDISNGDSRGGGNFSEERGRRDFVVFTRRSRNFVALIILFLGMLSAHAESPSLAWIASGQQGMTLKVHAGDQPMPDGFILYWQGNRLCTTAFLPEINGCENYALAEQSMIHASLGKMPMTSRQNCSISSCWPMACGTFYSVWLVNRHNGEQSPPITAWTLPCK